jgi:hypothetical protein
MAHRPTLAAPLALQPDRFYYAPHLGRAPRPSAYAPVHTTRKPAEPASPRVPLKPRQAHALHNRVQSFELDVPKSEAQTPCSSSPDLHSKSSAAPSPAGPTPWELEFADPDAPPPLRRLGRTVTLPPLTPRPTPSPFTSPMYALPSPMTPLSCAACGVRCMGRTVPLPPVTPSPSWLTPTLDVSSSLQSMCVGLLFLRSRQTHEDSHCSCLHCASRFYTD